MHVCNLSTWELRAKRSEVEGHLPLNSKFGHLTLSLRPVWATKTLTHSFIDRQTDKTDTETDAQTDIHTQRQLKAKSLSAQIVCDMFAMPAKNMA